MTETAPVDAGRAEKTRSRLSTSLILLFVLAGMLAVFSLLSRDFYSYLNISTMVTNIAFSGIVAGTLTLIMISGGLDISIGGNIALTSCLVAFLYDKAGWPSGLAILAGLALGTAIGAFNGVFITLLDLNPIITTLGTMAITRGMGYVLTKGLSIGIIEDLTGFISRGAVARIPVPIFLFAIVYVTLGFVLARSKFGRKIYSIGANQQAAAVSGIKTRKVKFLLYLFSGIAGSISGLILAGQTGVGMPQHGRGMELDVITAVLLGGCSLAGGKGSILGTLLGVFILAVLYNGFTMIGFRFVHISAFQGILLILVVALYNITR